MDAQPQTPISTEPKPKSPLSATVLQQHEYRVDHYLVIVPGEYTLDDILKPQAWLHVASKLKMYAVLTCISDIGAFDVDLRVVEATGRAVAVRPIRVAEYTDKEQDTYSLPEDAFEIRHVPNKGYGARNKFDGTWLFQGKVSKAEAHKALTEHLEATRKN